MEPLRVVELFAGIGAQAQALENLGIPFTSTVCEIDKRAYESYCAIHGDVPNLGDITKVDHLPDCDLLTYSFPCQDLSVAGCQRGMEEGSGTRSSLLWEVGRLLEDARERDVLPEYLLMENVDMILNSKNIGEFNRWIQTLKDMGYTSSYRVLNSRDFGVPQNRKRCFMVSALHDRSFIFPKGVPLTRCLRDVLEDCVDESFYMSDERIAKYEAHRIRHKVAGDGFGWHPTYGNGVRSSVTTKPERHASNFIIVAGDLNDEKELEMTNRVYGVDGISPACLAHGSNSIPKVEVESDIVIAGNLKSYKMEAANRVYGPEGVSPTVLSQIGGDLTPKIEESIAYPACTKQGFMEAYEGDGLVMNRLQTARGTVQPQTAPTLTTGKGCDTGVVVKLKRQDGSGKFDEARDGSAIRFSNPGGEGPITNPDVAYTLKAQVLDGVAVMDNDTVPDMEEGEVCAMLTPGRDKRQAGPRCKTDGTAFCVSCQDRHGVAMNQEGKLRIRYLTPRECWRLMGFPDEAFDKAVAAGIPKTHLYKQAGNSIVVDVLEAIFRGMFIDKTWLVSKGLEAWL